jgi:hypothetical protein
MKRHWTVVRRCGPSRLAGPAGRRGRVCLEALEDRRLFSFFLDGTYRYTYGSGSTALTGTMVLSGTNDDASGTTTGLVMTFYPAPWDGVSGESIGKGYYQADGGYLVAQSTAGGDHPLASFGGNYVDGVITGNFDIYTGAPTETVEPVTFTPAGTGGTGGSSGAAQLTPAIIKNTLPASAVNGPSTHGSETVRVSNTGSAIESGKTTVAVYASADGAIDEKSILLGSTTGKQTIKIGASKNVTVNIKSLPAVLVGSYTLLAQATNAAGDVTAATTGPALAAAAPFVAFSETFIKTTLSGSVVAGVKTAATETLTVTNNGNVASTGASTLSVYASADTTAADGTLIRTLPETIVLKPGASKTITVPLVKLPSLAAGDYHLVTQVTDHDSQVTSVASGGTFTLAARVP